jgi:hypothetical protein
MIDVPTIEREVGREIGRPVDRVARWFGLIEL